MARQFSKQARRRGTRTTTRKNAASSNGHVIVVRTMEELLERQRMPWEKVGHRGAVLDALRMCLQQHHPMPEWLSRPVEAAVTWWSREAPTGKRGRQARASTERRDIVEHLARAEFYEGQIRRGLTKTDARAITAEFFAVEDSTVRDSLQRVKRMAPETRYLAFDDRHQKWEWWTRDPKAAKDRIRLWGELEARYPPRRRPGSRLS